ncbi:MAG: aminotransferase class I/II-fold pyridoxal phosphate-dependent enzyme, partial [Rhodobacteraceae bacterium]|nr:aminotransferase class I/II-fold pyridoxal phosphate-dependent enzyme [Paracoccaceae bacterium]
MQVYRDLLQQDPREGEPEALVGKTVVIVAKNEARNIAECVASASFADEVVVLDSNSSDSTVALATEAGARVVPVPVDDDGIRVQELAVHDTVQLVYVTPSHQYPLGVTMSLARRQALLAWAAAAGAWIIEDDYDSEFRYADRPMLSLQGMDRGGRVLYVGTFNKVLFPGLRLGYLILPDALVDAFAAARRVSDGFSSPLLQGVVAEFLSRGHFAAYVRA